MPEHSQPDSVTTVAQHYITLLRQRGVTPQQDPEGGTAHPHLLWMLDMLISDPAMSLTKRHRWLGFIQGCLIKDGILTLAHEREWTRPVFSGD